MPTYLVSQATYTAIECALYADDRCITAETIDKKSACAQLMPTFKNLLEQHKITWKDIDFIGVNQGPAPFTTLRVLIATANGIAFATNKPLVGVDGLRTLWTNLPNPSETVVLLNAFNNDVYYAYQEQEIIKTGCAPLTRALTDLHALEKTLFFAGMGAELFKKEIADTLGARAQWLEPACAYTPLPALANACLQAFNSGAVVQQILPLYLKQPTLNV